jgi:hypothetical protein
MVIRLVQNTCIQFKKEKEENFVKDQIFTLSSLEYSIFKDKCLNLNMPYSVHIFRSSTLKAK